MTQDPIGDAVDHAPMRPASRARGGAHDVAETSARRARALRLRLSGGLTYEQIAEELGYADKSSVRGAILAALDRVEVRAVEEYRDVQHARLERMHAALWPLIVGSHTPTRPDGTPEPTYVDPATRIAAIRQATTVAARDARLLGLDAPQRLEVSGGMQAQLAAALLELREIVQGDGSVVWSDDDTGTPPADSGAASGG